MDRLDGTAFILLLGVFMALAQDERPASAGTPAEQYQALVQERDRAYEVLSKAKDDEENRQALASLGKLPLSFVELAERNPSDPVALDALIQTVSMVSSTLFP